MSVEGPYTERDRQLWAFLLHAVWDELGEVNVHEIPVQEINRVFRELGGDHNTARIWESATRLAKTTVSWRYTEGDTRYDGIAALFSAQISSSARKTGILQFNFPPLLVPILKDPRRFARLRTHFLIELSGKYAVTLVRATGIGCQQGRAGTEGQCRRFAMLALGAERQTAPVAGFPA